MTDVQVEIVGWAELKGGLQAFIPQLLDELRPGFIPQHRYVGMGGIPFTLEKIDLVARRLGFDEHG
jgi:hypothetical protein